MRARVPGLYRRVLPLGIGSPARNTGQSLEQQDREHDRGGALTEEREGYAVRAEGGVAACRQRVLHRAWQLLRQWSDAVVRKSVLTGAGA